MARREIYYEETAEGRDKGKVYKITEMPSEQGEEWAYRLLLSLSRSGVDLPEETLNLGMIGVAFLGVRALGGLQWHEAKALLDELMVLFYVTTWVALDADDIYVGE